MGEYKIKKTVLVTGSRGFIGKNLVQHLMENSSTLPLTFSYDQCPSTLRKLLMESDFVFHLAGVNKPSNEAGFRQGNEEFTRFLCNEIRLVFQKTGRKIPLVLSSSIHAMSDNEYGKSKKSAEQVAIDLSKEILSPVFIFRLPNVFGKWSRPNYNSMVATFCYNIAREIPITVNDSNAKIRLSYIDDVIERFLLLLDDSKAALDGVSFISDILSYETTVGEVASKLQKFHENRDCNYIENVGCGLLRALYSTYVSFLPDEKFAYSLKSHSDDRGSFVEFLRTKNCGQFSFFTARPGMTRGEHYHHTKTEKFLVVEGEAIFGFRNLDDGRTLKIKVNGKKSTIVDTIPGWVHDITNVGKTNLIVLLWSNEVFDKSKPDTCYAKTTL